MPTEPNQATQATQGGVCIVYSGTPFTEEEQAAFLDEAADEARWAAGTPINEWTDKSGRPPRRAR